MNFAVLTSRLIQRCLVIKYPIVSFIYKYLSRYTHCLGPSVMLHVQHLRVNTEQHAYKYYYDGLFTLTERKCILPQFSCTKLYTYLREIH